MIDLLKPVKVGVLTGSYVDWQPAVVVGKTIEETPRYDVRLDTGAYLSDIPEILIRVAA